MQKDTNIPRTAADLMVLIHDYAGEYHNWCAGYTNETTPRRVDDARNKIQDELVRLFTPVSDEWFRQTMLTLYNIELNKNDYADDIHLVRAVEAAHGVEKHPSMGNDVT